MVSILPRIAYAYFKVHSAWPIWYGILNLKARKLHKKQPLFLGTIERRIAQDLKRDGIAVAHLDELFQGKDILPVLHQYVEERKKEAETKTAKIFLRQLWDAVPTFNAGDPFVRLAMEEKILAVVNEYFGMYGKLYYFTLNITMPVNIGDAAIQSQRWHRDPEDKKLCKVFLYLNDVDETTGPFVYVRGSQYGGTYGNVFPQNPPRGCYPPEEDVLKAIPRDAIFTAVGKAGTVIFCDTVGLHKGGYATLNERIMFTGGYCTSASPWPLRYGLSDNARAELANMNLSSQVRYALDFTPRRIPHYLLRSIKKNLLY